MSCWVEKLHKPLFTCFAVFNVGENDLNLLSVGQRAASLIRGNRSNCALFCDNLDWLVSKLDRLEASSGIRFDLRLNLCDRIESLMQTLKYISGSKEIMCV